MVLWRELGFGLNANPTHGITLHFPLLTLQTRVIPLERCEVRVVENIVVGRCYIHVEESDCVLRRRSLRENGDC